MKVKTKTESTKFAPIEITITIESLEELKNLRNRLNVCPRKLNGIKGYGNHYFDTSDHELWNELDNLLGERI